MAQQGNHYDYILAGGGLSGLTLALKLQEKLPQKKVLIIDQDTKCQNDRTWSFWALPNHSIPKIACKKWKKIRIGDTHSSTTLKIEPYEYQTIRGIDFYQYAHNQIQQSPNIHFIKDKIIGLDGQKGIVQTVGKEIYSANLIFKSFFNNEDLIIDQTYPLLHQQFKGWVINTTHPAFDDTVVSMMDFNSFGAPTKDLRFFYVLPFSPTKALVEFTIFAKTKEREEYFNTQLNWYIKHQLKIQEFRVEEEEYNSIPMTNFPFDPKINDRVINIGTIGGFVKPSSGYAFTRTFSKINRIVEALSKNQTIQADTFTSPFQYRLCDSVLLDLLYHYKIPPQDTFERLYTLIPPPVLFRFLDEDASWLDILKVISICPQKHLFFISLIRQLLKSHKI